MITVRMRELVKKLRDLSDSYLLDRRREWTPRSIRTGELLKAAADQLEWYDKQIVKYRKALSPDQIDIFEGDTVR